MPVASPPPFRPAATASGGLWARRELIGQLTRRDIQGRYRGSVLGLLWPFLSPLFTLAVFAVVFGVILEGKFTGHPSESRADFALALYAGLVVFNFFAECLARAPGLILAAPNYVTRVVFPLEVLPVVSVAAALVHALISLVPLVLGVWWFRGGVPATMLELPLLFAPLLAWCLAVSWLFAAMGVFFRDLQPLMPTVSLVLMYASALFYPISRVPEAIRPFVEANPLAFFAESSRNVAVWGNSLDWTQYGIHLAVSVIAMLVGRAFFLRTKQAFADVM